MSKYFFIPVIIVSIFSSSFGLDFIEGKFVNKSSLPITGWKTVTYGINPSSVSNIMSGMKEYSGIPINLSITYGGDIKVTMNPYKISTNTAIRCQAYRYNCVDSNSVTSAVIFEFHDDQLFRIDLLLKINSKQEFDTLWRDLISKYGQSYDIDNNPKWFSTEGTMTLWKYNTFFSSCAIKYDRPNIDEFFNKWFNDQKILDKAWQDTTDQAIKENTSKKLKDAY